VAGGMGVWFTERTANRRNGRRHCLHPATFSPLPKKPSTITQGFLLHAHHPMCHSMFLCYFAIHHPVGPHPCEQAVTVLFASVTGFTHSRAPRRRPRSTWLVPSACPAADHGGQRLRHGTAAAAVATLHCFVAAGCPRSAARPTDNKVRADWFPAHSYKAANGGYGQLACNSATGDQVSSYPFSASVFCGPRRMPIKARRQALCSLFGGVE